MPWSTDTIRSKQGIITLTGISIIVPLPEVVPEIYSSVENDEKPVSTV